MRLRRWTSDRYERLRLQSRDIARVVRQRLATFRSSWRAARREQYVISLEGARTRCRNRLNRHRSKGGEMAGLARIVFSTLIILAAAHVARADEKVHVVKASSFADPADVVAFKKCLKSGKTAKQCLAVGDNGIGSGATIRPSPSPYARSRRRTGWLNGRSHPSRGAKRSSYPSTTRR